MKRAHFNLGCIFVLACLLVLSACKPDPILPAAAPTTAPTAIPATPQPTIPPVKPSATPDTHTWQASPVLLEMFTSAGFTTPEYAWSVVPSLVVYADGRVIVARDHYQADSTTRSIDEARLEASEVCRLLNQIAADGFLTLQQSDYIRPQVTDHGVTYITVNAWESNTISAYALGLALNQKDSGGQVPAALRATAERLINYLPPNTQPYQPDRLAIRLAPLDAPQAASSWPLTQPTLTELMAQAKNSAGVVLVEGKTAQEIYSQFAGSFTNAYSENGKIYGVTIRPVFPYEKWAPDQQGWSAVPTFATEPTTTLTCSPE